MSNLINLPNNFNKNLLNTNEFNLPTLQSGTANFQYNFIDKVVSRAIQINVGNHTTTDVIFSFAELSSIFVDVTKNYTFILSLKSKATIDFQMRLYANNVVSQEFDFKTSQDDNFESLAQVLELEAGFKYDIDFIIKSNPLNKISETVKIDAFCLSPQIFDLNTNFIFTPKLKELQTSWKFQSTKAVTVSITNETKVDLTELIFGAGSTQTFENNPPFYYDSVNNLIRANANTTDYYSFLILPLFSGEITSTGDIYELSLHRPNDTIFRIYEFQANRTTAFVSEQKTLIASHVDSGGADNFQLPIDTIEGGFRIKISKPAGAGQMNLSGNQSIRIQR